MPQLMPAACLLAASFFSSALGQNAPAPCPADTDTTKTKIKKGFGNVLKNTPLGRTVTGGASASSTPCPAAPASSLPSQSDQNPVAANTDAAANGPAPLPDDKQPRPGTVRHVSYQGQDIAIATGKDGNSDRPVTYVIIPGSVRPPVKLTADPNVYVSVNTPPTVYTVKNGELTITDPPKPQAQPNQVSSIADAFGGRRSGTVTGDGFTLQWSHDTTRGGVEYIRILQVNREGQISKGSYLGHNADGDFVQLQVPCCYFVITSNGQLTKLAQRPGNLK